MKPLTIDATIPALRARAMYHRRDDVVADCDAAIAGDVDAHEKCARWVRAEQEADQLALVAELAAIAGFE